MEFDTRFPIYLQIMEKIKKDIISGNLKKGEKMPSVRNMANELKVNVNTMQRVYQELEREGVLITQRGTGTFVTENDEVILAVRQQIADELLSSFVKGMRELGLDNNSILARLSEYMEVEENGTTQG